MDLLKHNNAGREIVLLQGVPGSGKTVLSLVIAQQLQGAIPLQLMVTGNSAAAYCNAMASFAYRHIGDCTSDLDQVQHIIHGAF